MIQVMLAGEGRNELGDWADHPSYRSGRTGVLEALARKVRAEGWTVAEGVQWKHLRKFVAGAKGDGDRKNVERLLLRARELGCDVVVFSRDTDGQTERRADIERAIEAHERGPLPTPRVAGGVAEPKLEAWILALAGATHSEDRGHLLERLAELGVGEKDTRAMVAVVERADLEHLPADALSLHSWLGRARTALLDPAGSTR